MGFFTDFSYPALAIALIVVVLALCTKEKD